MADDSGAKGLVPAAYLQILDALVADQESIPSSSQQDSGGENGELCKISRVFLITT